MSGFNKASNDVNPVVDNTSLQIYHPSIHDPIDKSFGDVY